MKYKLIPSYIRDKEKYAENLESIEVKDMYGIVNVLMPRLYNKNTNEYARISRIVEINKGMQYIIFDENYGLSMSKAEYEVYLLGIL